MANFIGQMGYYDGSLRSGGVYDRGDEPSTADIRTFIENETLTANEVVNRKKAADDFVVLHPEFVDCESNGRLMRHEMEVRGCWPSPSPQDFEQAYVSLSEAGLLKLNQAKINAQRAQELDKRAAEIKAGQFNEGAAYEMSMEELEAHCRGWK
jgi:hypothetical protein